MFGFVFSGRVQIGNEKINNIIWATSVVLPTPVFSDPRYGGMFILYDFS